MPCGNFNSRAACPERTPRRSASGADLTTWNAVVDAARETHIHHGPAEPLRPLFQPMQTISPGEQNMHLYLAQGMLQALRHYYDGMPPVSVTGRHDEACTACLKWLQARCGLPVTGELDRRTWQHMVRLYAQTVGDGTGSYPVRIAHPEETQTPQRV